MALTAGVPNLQVMDLWYQSRPVRNQAAQQEVSLHVMRLNHPETILPSQSMEKLSAVNLVPAAKKVRDCCLKGPFQFPHPGFSSDKLEPQATQACTPTL